MAVAKPAGPFDACPRPLVKRVFNIDVSTCVHCGGAVQIVASIEEPTAIRLIFAHFEKHGALLKAHYRPVPRAPPAVAACQPAGHDAEGETRQEHTKRQQTRRKMLGPLPEIGEKWPPTARRRGPALPKSHSRTSDPQRNWRLRDQRLLAKISKRAYEIPIL